MVIFRVDVSVINTIVFYDMRDHNVCLEQITREALLENE